MTYQEQITNWKEVSDFFFSLEIQTEEDYKNGKISKWKRDRLQAQIKRDWDYNMIINNPFIKNNATLKEVAKCFFKMDNLP